jgi:hypothetical protein
VKRPIKITLLVIGISGSLFVIVSLLVLFSGLNDLAETQRSMEEFFAWQKEEAILTDNENEFKDSLTKCGFYVEIHRPYTDRLENYEDFNYNVLIQPSKLYNDPKNYELLDSIREQVARQLIRILPDSVLSEMDHLKLNYRLLNGNDGLYSSQSETNGFSLEIEKNEMEIGAVLGARVVKKDGVFFREPFNE